MILGTTGFFLHYWSTTEINLYRTYAKTTKTPTISIDATGGIVRKPILMSGRITSNIFLYEICVMDRINYCQFSVAHMLSERHDNNIIGNWLSEWQGTGVPRPKVIVTDQSLALMMAAVTSFTQYSSLAKYLDICSLLINNKTTELSKCMLRNDFNHVMHILSTWFDKQISKRIKHFYLCSSGLIISSTDFKDIKLLLKYIFTIAFSETDGYNLDGTLTDCEFAKQYLKCRIAGITFVDDFISNLESTSEFKEDNHNPLTSKDDFESIVIHEEIQEIHDTCLNESMIYGKIGDHDNMQYDTNIAKKLLKFCKLLPCWSAIMTPIFKYGNITESSASFESLFKDLKHIVLQHKTLPIRIDDFIKVHVDSIIGTNNIIKSKMNINNKDNEEVQDDYDTTKPNEINMNNNNNIQDHYQSPEKEFESAAIKNWKGLGEVEKTKKKKEIIWKKIKPYYITMKTAKPKVQLLEYCEMETFQIFFQLY